MAAASATKSTSTGHEVSDVPWLGLHFRSSRREYEESLLSVGLRPGCKVLDAGCGGGDFLPLMSECVGSSGAIVALDLAPENIARVEALKAELAMPAPITAQVGSVLNLPFEDAGFDCVWSANVVQYLRPAEFDHSVAEARRVLKPGGLLAIKEFDASILQIEPLDRGVFSRFMTERLARFAERGVLGTACGTSIPARLRQLGLQDIRRRGWLVERWADAGPDTRAYVADLLGYFASVAPQYDLPPGDRDVWSAIAADPELLLDDPDFCYREFFVLTVAVV